ncbi:integrase catalytic domain-containing protein, partial [Nephila pilipes]
FIFNCKNPGNKKEGPLTSEEMMEAEYFLLKQEQHGAFHSEMTAMKNGDDICHKSKILNLSPFLDGKGVIRIRRSLENS